MKTITGSVGFGGVNNTADVLTVQSLLNDNRGRVLGARDVAIDGIAGPQTIQAIRLFQQQIVKSIIPDGRVDPNGLTFRELGQTDNGGTHISVTSAANIAVVGAGKLRFPLRKRPSLDYHKGPKGGARYFGANRKTHSGGFRAHAGIDLIAPKGTEILAIADGEIIQDMYHFYLGTYALEVRHDGGFVVRYGEIMGVASGVKKGSKVKRGQVIAYVGLLSSGSSMLHFEMYSGTANGSLSATNKPYYRRSDLIDPTSYIDAATLI
jgi:murein DD-endopeptidase MepM/ murein hydrolase activator NlpD